MPTQSLYPSQTTLDLRIPCLLPGPAQASSPPMSLPSAPGTSKLFGDVDRVCDTMSGATCVCARPPAEQEGADLEVARKYGSQTWAQPFLADLLPARAPDSLGIPISNLASQSGTKVCLAREERRACLYKTQVTNTRPAGRIQPSTFFYPARHLISTQWQRGALT